MRFHNNLLGYSSIRLPFWLFAVPVVFPKVVVWFEHRVHFHVQGRKRWEHAIVVVALTDCVVLERDPVGTPVLKADRLDWGKTVEGTSLEVNHWFVVRRGAFWEDKDRGTVALLVFLLTLLDCLAYGYFFFLCPCSLKEHAINGFCNASNTWITLNRNFADKTWEEVCQDNDDIHPAHMVANDSSDTVPLWLPLRSQILLKATILHILKIDPHKAANEGLHSAAEIGHAPYHFLSELPRLLFDPNHKDWDPNCIDHKIDHA